MGYNAAWCGTDPLSCIVVYTCDYIVRRVHSSASSPHCPCAYAYTSRSSVDTASSRLRTRGEDLPRQHHPRTVLTCCGSVPEHPQTWNVVPSSRLTSAQAVPPVMAMWLSPV